MGATIGVIDYGMGNLHSLAKALERVADGQRIEVSYDPDKLRKCDRLVLPGVGGVRACMDELRRLELNQLVLEAAREVPLLGICLGMQVLLGFSEENGGVPALGLIPGSVVRFPEPAGEGAERLKVPHMGWNQVHWTRPHPVCKGVPDGNWFYFVHSYHAKTESPDHVLGETHYGEAFPSAIARHNIIGFQFHPEKSHAAGLRLLANFAVWDGHPDN
jgi:glutamine amidotransferase